MDPRVFRVEVYGLGGQFDFIYGHGQVDSTAENDIDSAERDRRIEFEFWSKVVDWKTVHGTAPVVWGRLGADRDQIHGTAPIVWIQRIHVFRPEKRADPCFSTRKVRGSMFFDPTSARIHVFRPEKRADPCFSTRKACRSMFFNPKSA